jgi:glycerate 2-kinase
MYRRAPNALVPDEGPMDRRNDLRRIARAALESVDPLQIVRRSLRVEGGTLQVRTRGVSRDFDLACFPRVFVLGFGKAVGPMAKAVEEALGPRIERGLVVVKPGHEAELKLIRQVPGGHPVPDESSARAAAAVASLADEADERTLVVTLISGGGSSLIAAPVDPRETGLSLADIQEATRQLLACGAAIGEMNCVRKHLLLLAGGRLARRIAPATSVSLVLSDVVGDDLQTIASGPTCADSTTYDQALSIVQYYGIDATLPAPVMGVLHTGASGRIPETLKPGEREVAASFLVLVGSNLLALQSASETAARLGYHPLVLTSHMAGEAREAARVLAAVAKDVAASDTPCQRPACILAGGETTVTLRGNGKGGRNQEMAVAFLLEMELDPALLSRAWFLSFATDGEDGPTDAAGGFADPAAGTAARAAGLNVQDALLQNDSYTFLGRIKGRFVTGPTSTNVCDIQILIVV